MPKTASRLAPADGSSSIIDHLDRFAADLVNLLSGIERVGNEAPAAIAFRLAIRRKGREFAEAVGVGALKEALVRVRAADLGRADAREAVITAEWASLPGWSA